MGSYQRSSADVSDFIPGSDPPTYSDINNVINNIAANYDGRARG